LGSSPAKAARKMVQTQPGPQLCQDLGYRNQPRPILEAVRPPLRTQIHVKSQNPIKSPTTTPQEAPGCPHPLQAPFSANVCRVTNRWKFLCCALAFGVTLKPASSFKSPINEAKGSREDRSVGSEPQFHRPQPARALIKTPITAWPENRAEPEKPVSTPGIRPTPRVSKKPLGSQTPQGPGRDLGPKSEKL
jgi:hypothetical protein